jgi:hypothetical protein
MALVSPGVEVDVIDESFYTPAAPGTVPMIFVASAQDKPNGSGTGTAPGTLAANSGKPYLLTSQRELAETFGDPVFYTDANNNPIHAGELNEYGLQTAYSMLGVSNRVYVTRADIDLDKLQPQSEEPGADPENGQNWLNTQTTQWGIFEWNSEPATETNGQTFTSVTPIVIYDWNRTTGTVPYAPKASVGAIGQYAVVAVTNTIKIFYKNLNNEWVIVGSSQWKASLPVVKSATSVGNLGTTESITIELSSGVSEVITDNSNDLNAFVSNINTNTNLNNAGISASNNDGVFELYNDGSDSETLTISGNSDLLQALKIDAGDYTVAEAQISPHTDVPEFKLTDTTPRPSGSVWIKTTEPNGGARWRFQRWNSETRLWETIETPLYSSNVDALYKLDRSGGGVNLAVGQNYARYNVSDADPQEATFKIYTRAVPGTTTIVSSPVSEQLTADAEVSFKLSETDANSQTYSASTISFGTSGSSLPSLQGNSSDADTIAAAINAANFDNIVASVDNQNRVVIEHLQGGDILIEDNDSILNSIGFVSFLASDPSTTTNLYQKEGGTTDVDLVATNWKASEYVADDEEPQNLATDGELWYNSIIDEVDIMIHNGTTWVGYQEFLSDTDPNGPQVRATEPTQQSDTSLLVNGDLWIDTSDIENYPTIYRWNNNTQRWVLIDKTDQTTENGILFADARYNTSGENSGEAGSITDLLTSNYLDPDAPDPALYPKGMLLWNLRRSGFNVKRFKRNYIDQNADNDRFNNGEAMSDYYPHRWVTESANEADGSGSFGKVAQRKVVVQSLQAMLNSNDDIRDDESRIFNIMATPGYPELIGEMISLNYDRRLSAFVVGDSPANLTPDATSLNEWGQNVRNAVEDNDQGLVSFDEYMGVYYPWGFTSDNAGNNVVVPPSHMALRTIALSDQVSYPWFAPAGTRRGGVTNATSTGYVNSEGEFVAVSLNEGQRDTLYSNAINPITFLSGSGLVVFGQKTRARNASSLDRINVARLVIYMRGQLERLSKPYLFEPNDKITRDEIKGAAESLCLELVGQRALYDFLVVCDESNNTPARIDRNELYLDIAIEPVKAVEFIYIPLRLKNTGEIAGLN